MKKIHGSYFYGEEISYYGLEKGYVDYSTLAKAVGSMVLNNNIIRTTFELGNWELDNGSDYDEENDEYVDIYQYFIITPYGAEILTKWTDEIVYYNEVLDMYVWGVAHWGTAWDYVLTNIKIEEEKQQ